MYGVVCHGLRVKMVEMNFRDDMKKLFTKIRPKILLKLREIEDDTEILSSDESSVRIFYAAIQHWKEKLADNSAEGDLSLM